MNEVTIITPETNGFDASAGKYFSLPTNNSGENFLMGFEAVKIPQYNSRNAYLALVGLGAFYQNNNLNEVQQLVEERFQHPEKMLANTRKRGQQDIFSVELPIHQYEEIIGWKIGQPLIFDIYRIGGNNMSDVETGFLINGVLGLRPNILQEELGRITYPMLRSGKFRYKP